jgi:hypothetical protein
MNNAEGDYIAGGFHACVFTGICINAGVGLIEDHPNRCASASPPRRCKANLIQKKLPTTNACTLASQVYTKRWKWICAHNLNLI